MSDSPAPAPPYNAVSMDGDRDDDAEDTTAGFSRCPDCGDIVVSQSRHQCSTGDTHKGYIPREEREHLAHQDDRDADRDVLVPAGVASTRYHEIKDADELEARCWTGPDPEDATTRTQEGAAERGYAPCGACRVVADATDEQGT